jgi:hypothetical protein
LARELAAKLMLQNLMEEQKDRHLALCINFMEQLQEDKKIIFWIVSSLVMKHGVISMILRPNANPKSGDQRISPDQRSHGCRSPRSK